jgi:hypothetical protein
MCQVTLAGALAAAEPRAFEHKLALQQLPYCRILIQMSAASELICSISSPVACALEQELALQQLPLLERSVKMHSTSLQYGEYLKTSSPVACAFEQEHALQHMPYCRISFCMSAVMENGRTASAHLLHVHLNKNLLCSTFPEHRNLYRCIPQVCSSEHSFQASAHLSHVHLNRNLLCSSC